MATPPTASFILPFPGLFAKVRGGTAWRCARDVCVCVSCKISGSDHEQSMNVTVGSLTSLLRTLHWLPIQERIEYKLPTLSHSLFSDTAPVCVPGLRRVYSPSKQLRSSPDSRTLRIAHLKTRTFGHRSFCVCCFLCLVKEDTFSQPLHLEQLGSSVSLKPTASKLYIPTPHLQTCS